MVWTSCAGRLQLRYETPGRSSRKKKKKPYHGNLSLGRNSRAHVKTDWIIGWGYSEESVSSLTCPCSATGQGCLWNLPNEGITGGCNLITTSQPWSKSSLVRGSEFRISVCCSACSVPQGTSLLLFGKELVWGSSFLFPPFLISFFFFSSIKNQTYGLTHSRLVLYHGDIPSVPRCLCTASQLMKHWNRTHWAGKENVYKLQVSMSKRMEY